MRLSSKEISIIKNKVEVVFGEALVYLFGSRIDESKKGERLIEQEAIKGIRI